MVTADDHTFSLNEKALKTLLLDKQVKDSKVIVVSVAGRVPQGKVVLLDFFLRYLHAKVREGREGGTGG